MPSIIAMRIGTGLATIAATAADPAADAAIDHAIHAAPASHRTPADTRLLFAPDIAAPPKGSIRFEES